MNAARFYGQVAVVTGGASGIGLATAQRLAAEGANVSIWDIDEAAAQKTGYAAHTVRMDQTDCISVRAAAQSAISALVPIDILVVSAGVTGPNTTVEDYPDDAWRRVIDVNLNGVFYCNQAIIPIMRQNDYGRIVNVASVAGKEGNRNASAYSASNRRRVLGDDGVDRSLASRTPFTADFQAMITRIAWQEIWGRPGLDDRTRRLLVLAITVSLGRWEEFALHVRAGLVQGGFTPDELKEVLMQTAIYAGVPAANTGFAEAAKIIAELG